MIPFGDAPFGDESSGPVIPTGPEINFEIPIQWDLKELNFEVPIYWSGLLDVAFEIPIEWALKELNFEVPIHWLLSPELNFEVPIHWQQPDITGFPVDSQTNTWQVLIDGVDFSSRLTGSGEIDRQKDASTIANFSLALEDGVTDPMDWIGKRVTLDVISNGEQIRRFNGLIEDAPLELYPGIVYFSATTNQQGYFENLSRAEIDQRVGGYYSKHVFNDDSDGWTYAQDRLSTQFAMFVQDANGTPQIVSRKPKATPDYVFTASDVVAGSVGTPKRANRRDLLNRCRIKFQHRYKRLRERHIQVVFEHAMHSGNATRLDFCDYLLSPYTLCQRANIESAIRNNNWKLLGDIYYGALPPNDVYDCRNTAYPGSSLRVQKVWNTPEETADLFCLSAKFLLALRFSQSITEECIYDVQAPNSIEHSGEVGLDLSFSVDRKYDAGDWEKNEGYTAPENGAVVDSSGDWIIDIDDGEGGRDEYNNAVITALAHVVSDMEKSHQENEQEFSLPFHAAIKVGDTAHLQCGVDIKGLVTQVRDIDDGEGRLLTAITLNYSAHGGTGLVTSTALDPADQPVADIPENPVKDMLIGYHIGGEPTSQPEQEDWQGFFTNRLNFLNFDYERYDSRFKLILPEIDPAYRDSVVATGAKTVLVDIEEDHMTITI